MEITDTDTSVGNLSMSETHEKNATKNVVFYDSIRCVLL